MSLHPRQASFQCAVTQTVGDLEAEAQGRREVWPGAQAGRGQVPARHREQAGLDPWRSCYVWSLLLPWGTLCDITLSPVRASCGDMDDITGHCTATC